MRHSFIFTRDQTRLRQCDIGAAVVLSFQCIGSWKSQNLKVKSLKLACGQCVGESVIYWKSKSLKVCSMLVATVRRSTVSICCKPSLLHHQQKCCSDQSWKKQVKLESQHKQTNVGKNYVFSLIIFQFVSMVRLRGVSISRYTHVNIASHRSIL